MVNVTWLAGQPATGRRLLGDTQMTGANQHLATVGKAVREYLMGWMFGKEKGHRDETVKQRPNEPPLGDSY